MKLRPKIMKLSDSTVNLLKNFSNINQSLLFKQGNSLRTISVMKNILAEAVIDEELPKDFGIYDLNQFLNGMSLHHDPELDFENENYVVIREGRSNQSKYFFADPNVIITPPDKTLTLPSEDVSFVLTTQNLDRLLKAAAVYQVPDLSAIGSSGVVKLVIRDKKNDTANNFSMVVGETDKSFEFNFKVENIKVIPGSYEVVVSKSGLSKFTSKDRDLSYFIALEPDVKYEE